MTIADNMYETIWATTTKKTFDEEDLEKVRNSLISRVVSRGCIGIGWIETTYTVRPVSKYYSQPLMEVTMRVEVEPILP